MSDPSWELGEEEEKEKELEELWEGMGEEGKKKIVAVLWDITFLYSYEPFPNNLTPSGFHVVYFSQKENAAFCQR